MEITSIVVAIDTNQYAGNFEREMCAYITGQYGDCGVGDDIANTEKPNIQNYDWFNQHVVQEDDDSAYVCRRPCAIWPTQGWINDGMGTEFKDTPENRQLAKESAYTSMVAYHKNQKDLVEQRLADKNFDARWTEEACTRTLSSIQNSLQQIKESTNLYPAYMSVGIFFDAIPPENVMDEIVKRALDFAEQYNTSKNPKTPLCISGVRIQEPKLVKPCQIEHVDIKSISFEP